MDIRVMPHCLVIITRQPEQDEPECIQSLRKLSPRKQQQVADIIAMVTGKPLPKKPER
ncbi:hypothetical protein [Erwinia sp. V71]|uniref:hypothetical protein n=1 Tax=Erwinia sp. V71 TaxID=3369424 RepID=UPI003F613AE1